VRYGLRVWQLLRRLLLEHDDETNYTKTQVSRLKPFTGAPPRRRA
jgi:hypothetical protein